MQFRAISWSTEVKTSIYTQKNSKVRKEWKIKNPRGEFWEFCKKCFFSLLPLACWWLRWWINKESTHRHGGIIQMKENNSTKTRRPWPHSEEWKESVTNRFFLFLFSCDSLERFQLRELEESKRRNTQQWKAKMDFMLIMRVLHSPGLIWLLLCSTRNL